MVYLDEPTIGLDLSAQRAIRDFILDYRQQRCPAMVVTSHYMEDIERLCERILILREGELVYDGLLQEVARRFTDHKIVSATLRKGDGELTRHPKLDEVGEVVEFSDVEIRLKVPRDGVAAAAGALLDNYPVADFSVEEEDVASIIEKIQRAQEELPE